MKKLYLLLLPFIIDANAEAQVTITRADFGQIGDQILYAYDTTLASNFSVGASGENKTWDFSYGNVSGDYYDQTYFSDPTTIQGAPEEANLAITSNSEAGFYYIDNDNVRIVISLPIPGTTTSSPSLKIASFPMEYLSKVEDSSFSNISSTPEDLGFSGLPFDSIRITIKVNTRSLADGWGTLKIDNDSFQTLRVKNDTKFNVKIEGVTVVFGAPIAVPIQTINQNQTVFAWYGNDKDYTLAQAELDSNGNVATFQYQIKEIPEPTGIAPISASIASSIQPNPANEELHLNFNSNYSEKGTLVVVDITGKVIINQPITIVKDVNDITIKTTDLNNGIYFARIVSEHINTTSKFVVRH